MTPEKVYIKNSGEIVEKESKETTAYVRQDIYNSLAHSLEIEQDKNESLRKGIESLQHQVEHYKTLLRTKQDAPHFHDETPIIHKP